MEKMLYCVFAGSIIGICSAHNPLARIIYGDTVDIKDYPYQVSIRWVNKERGKPRGHFCGGAIIDKNHILSAAHCFIQFSHDTFEPKIVLPEEIAIHAGTSKLDDKGSVYKVENIANHPEYISETVKNDIAVLKLSKTISFGDTQKPIDLPSHNIENKTVGMVTGWGDTYSYQSGSFAEKLQKISVIVLDRKACRKVAYEAKDLDNTQICAYNKTRTLSFYKFQGVCSGDSGGPLVVENQLVGIVSSSFYHHCGTGLPDIYSNVYSYLDFIKKNSMN